MGTLGGFSYRIVKRKLKKFGFEFLRQASGSHEIWFNPTTNLYTTIPNHHAIFRRGLYLQFLSKLGYQNKIL